MHERCTCQDVFRTYPGACLLGWVFLRTASARVFFVSKFGVFSLVVYLVIGGGIFSRFPPLRVVWLLLRPLPVPLVVLSGNVSTSRPISSAWTAGPGGMVHLAEVTRLFEYCRWPVRLLHWLCTGTMGYVTVCRFVPCGTVVGIV